MIKRQCENPDIFGLLEVAGVAPPGLSKWVGFTLRRTIQEISEAGWFDRNPLSLEQRLQIEETLLPLVGYLTTPKSVETFLHIRQLLFGTMTDLSSWRLNSEKLPPLPNESLTGLFWWLRFILPEIKVIPGAIKEELEICYHIPPRSPYPEPCRPEEKIVSLKGVSERVEKCHLEDQESVALIVGKWRLGLHQEHVDLLEKARRVVGPFGLVIVGLESQRSVHQRRGQDHHCLPDQTRLMQLVANQSTDLVVLLNPTSEGITDLEQYYSMVWRVIAPDFYIFGDKNYHWRPIFAQRAQTIPLLLLWAREVNTVSATSLLKDLK